MRQQVPSSARNGANSANTFAAVPGSCTTCGITHRSSLSRHQPVNCGSPEGAAVLAFWTLNQLAAPTRGECGGFQVDAVDAEAVQFLER
jgi:hypothetical protein